MITWLNNLKRKIIKNSSDGVFVVFLFLLAILLVIFLSQSAFAEEGNNSYAQLLQWLLPFEVLPLKTEINLVSIFSGTLIIIALIERSIELLLPLFESWYSSTETNSPDNQSNTSDQQKMSKENFALIIGLVIGLLASFVGIRILEPLVDIDQGIPDFQLLLFRCFDIIFSAMGIATGSHLFHIFPSLTSSVLEGAKAQSDANKRNIQQTQTSITEGGEETEGAEETEVQPELIQSSEKLDFGQIIKIMEANNKLVKEMMEMLSLTSERQIDSDNEIPDNK